MYRRLAEGKPVDVMHIVLDGLLSIVKGDGTVALMAFSIASQAYRESAAKACSAAGAFAVLVSYPPGAARLARQAWRRAARQNK